MDLLQTAGTQFLDREVCLHHSGLVSNPDVKEPNPTEGEVKMNVDGAAAMSSNMSAVGVVCRSAAGLFLGASAVVFQGVTEPTTLEAYACREALALAKDLVMNKVRIASDCLRVINNLRARCILAIIA